MPLDPRVRSDTPDRELMQQIRQADQSALMLIYARYGNAVYSLALNVVRDAGLAEEVTQDTFLKVWKQADRWDAGKGQFSSWLLTIARHTAIDHYRKLQRRPAVVAALEDAPASLGQAAMVDTQQWADGQLLARLLDRLPPEQAQVVQLAFYQGMSHSELAESLNLPLGTVKTRVRLGLQKLKVLWQAATGDMNDG